MKITEELYMLMLPVEMPHQSHLHMSAIKDENNLVLVDTGMDGPDYLEKMQKLFQEDNLDFSNLDTIILTHQDFDHIGGLHEILGSSEKSVEVYFHEAEKDYIVGDKELIKGNRKKMPSLFRLLRKKTGRERDIEPDDGSDIKVIRILKDGELLPFGGGLKVIHAPGHTPGNICLYHEKSKTLIAGDTVNYLDGKLIGPNPQFTPDFEQAMESMKKLLDYDIQRIICYHGGLYEDNPNEKIRQILVEYETIA